MGSTGQPGAPCECLVPSSHSSFLSTPAPPQIAGPREPHAQVSVVQDGEVTLECNVTGKPLPRVTWERDGQLVGAEPGLRLQNQGQSLHVERAQAAHTGRYSCVAENVAGRAKRQFVLSVLGEDRQPAGGGHARGCGQRGGLEKARPVLSHALLSQEADPQGGRLLLGKAGHTALKSGMASHSPACPALFPASLPHLLFPCSVPGTGEISSLSPAWLTHDEGIQEPEPCRVSAVGQPPVGGGLPAATEEQSGSRPGAGVRAEMPGRGNRLHRGPEGGTFRVARSAS